VVSHGDASRIILSGEPMDAEAALRMGLVHRVVPRDALEQEVMATAERIAARPPELVRSLKRVLWQGADLPLAEALSLEARTLARRAPA
jgi:enoyl-CoA hydratase/carnithine racemase